MSEKLPKQNYVEESNRLAKLFWENDDSENSCQTHLNFALVASLYLDPKRDALKQRKELRNLTSWNSKWNDAANAVQEILEDCASRLLAGTTPDKVKQYLAHSQPAHESIWLACNDTDLARMLYQKFCDGDNYVELGYLWRNEEIVVGACYSWFSTQERVV